MFGIDEVIVYVFSEVGKGSLVETAGSCTPGVGFYGHIMDGEEMGSDASDDRNGCGDGDMAVTPSCARVIRRSVNRERT